MVKVVIILLLGLFAFHLIYVYQRSSECSRLYREQKPFAHCL